MPGKLKAFFRRTGSSSSGRTLTQPPLAERHPESAQAAPHAKHQPSTQSTHEPARSVTPSNDEYGRVISSPPQSRRDSPRPPPSHKPPVAATDYGQPDPEDNDESITGRHSLYTPEVSPDGGPTGTGHMSLGGDRRLIEGVSEQKHSEDVADRNIAHYGSASPRHSSIPTSMQGEPQLSKRTSDVLGSHQISLRKGSVGGNSMGSVGSPGSFNSVASKYTLGTGVATEGSLVDGILPHVEGSESRKCKPTDRPSRIARDELRLSWGRRKPRGSSDEDAPRITRGSPGDSAESPSEERPPASKEGLIDLRKFVMGGQRDGPSDEGPPLDGIVDLRDTEDVDKATHWAPAVTHEVVKPTEHHIREEKIYREIHNHDVYHRVQPVYETEILPARHFLRGSNNELVEVSEEQLPYCTGANQRWFIAEKEQPATEVSQRRPRLTEPKVVADQTTMTPAGFERREITIVHSPELEDMSDYASPVLPLHFVHEAVKNPEEELEETDRRLNRRPVTQSLTLKELADTLPATSIPERTSSLRH